MYITFLLCLVAALSILFRARLAGAMVSLLTVAVIGGLLIYHMTDKLPISL
jgi:hypothetical protein